LEGFRKEVAVAYFKVMLYLFLLLRRCLRKIHIKLSQGSESCADVLAPKYKVSVLYLRNSVGTFETSELHSVTASPPPYQTRQIMRVEVIELLLK
jgi:hypothetical protein